MSARRPPGRRTRTRRGRPVGGRALGLARLVCSFRDAHPRPRSRLPTRPASCAGRRAGRPPRAHSKAPNARQRRARHPPPVSCCMLHLPRPCRRERLCCHPTVPDWTTHPWKYLVSWLAALGAAARRDCCHQASGRLAQVNLQPAPPRVHRAARQLPLPRARDLAEARRAIARGHPHLNTAGAQPS
jgi:hypothetical protein